MEREENLTLCIARICHEANRAYCKAVGDESQLPWDEAPQWQKDSAAAGVAAHLDDPHMTPKMSHAAWLERKTREGWVYGEAKDAVAKTHPCILPYDKLTLRQQQKDHLFTAIVAVMAPK